jgi:uncharacterized membrane protein
MGVVSVVRKILLERMGVRSMSSNSVDQGRATVITSIFEEYREMRAEIRVRIDLQHRNMNVLVVLVTTATGFLIIYYSANARGNAAPLASSAVSLLFPVVCIFINVFIWRHANHDSNVIDKSMYISTVLRPRLIAATSNKEVLGLEAFLKTRRYSRARRWDLVVQLGQDSVPMFVLLALYLATSWVFQIHVGRLHGSISVLYLTLAILSSFLTAISTFMTVRVGLGYRGILDRAAVQSP